MSYNVKDYPATHSSGEKHAHQHAHEEDGCVCKNCGKGCQSLKRILLPVDMSDASRLSFHFAWDMAVKTGASMDVLYVMDSIFDGKHPSSTGFLSGYQDTLKKELDEFVQAQITEIAEAAVPDEDSLLQKTTPSPTINTLVSYGFPEQAIAAEAEHYDLVVMGTAGRNSAIGERLFGSVSTEVAKNALVPVLFIPPDASFSGFRNILYASNTDSLSGKCIKKAVRFAQWFESQLHFVHVGRAGEPDVEEQYRLFKGNFLSAEADQHFIFERMIEDESTINALYDYAFNHRIDALVFVTHHRSFWESLFHKSTTSKALQSTGLPILVLHQEDRG